MSYRSILLIALVTVMVAARTVSGEPTNGKVVRVSRARLIRLWHTPPTLVPSRTAEGRPKLVLEVINTRERIELSPSRDDGGFSNDELARAAHTLRDHRTGEEYAVEPRLLDLAYRLQIHFDAKAVRILSAYRSGTERPSNHTRGRALDLIVPGRRDHEVAAYARTMGFVGVGLYSVSGFVHLDSRPRSYFWVDTSGPGQRPRLQRVFAGLGAKADAQALARGEKRPTDEPTSSSPSEEPPPNDVFNASVVRPNEIQPAP